MAVDIPVPGHARSFWLQEALADDPGEPCPPLRSDISADVCVIGGGFAGLWTAIALTDREQEMRVVLLESDICGGGASGRNGGFVASSWWDIAGLVGMFGKDEGLRYAQLVADQVSWIGDWVREHNVDCWYHQEGGLIGEAEEWQRGNHDDDVDTARRLGVPDVIVPFTAEQARGIAESPRWVAGTFSPDCAICQPARLARGLRRVALERGVHIFENTKARKIEHGVPAVIHTGSGAVRADQVVLSNGAWAASWAGFRTAFANIADYVVATEPIPERLAEIGWTSMTGIGDSRDDLFYLRPTDDGRIVIGGGALGFILGGRADGRAATHDAKVAQAAAEGLLWLFPQLQGVRFTHAWGGPIDQTASFVPFFQTRPPGNVHAGLGFSGHGLTQTRIGGEILASLVLGAADEWTSLPVVGPPIRRVPPEPIRYLGVRAVGWGLNGLERAMQEGRQPSAPQRALASLIDRMRPGS
ncbi:MAG: FAD-dependent oxidoreductase [Actinomycetes bacterium]